MARLEKGWVRPKQALMLDAPKKEKLKELGEGIFEMFRIDPDLTAPLLAMVTTMLGVKTSEKAKAGLRERTDFQVQKRSVIAELSMSNTAEIINFPTEPNNREVVWPTCRTGIPRSLTRSKAQASSENVRPGVAMF
jgi:hypothetical protein